MPKNPTWERDELILALDLYLRVGMACSEHPEVMELSGLLNQLALNPTRPLRYREAVNRLDEAERRRLRNPNGVAMKLANFAALDPSHSGVALSRDGKRDAEVWGDFATNREKLACEASLIRARAACGEPSRRSPQYWAFCANPDTYRVEDAVREVSTDAWTTKGKPIHVGDKVIIWKAKGNSDWRGVVALGEVLTDPYLRTAEHRTYYQQNADANKIEERVAIRYIRPPRLPLVMDGDATDVLHNLSVSRATGGTVFRVTPEQWDAVVEAAGGWPNAADHDKDPYSELTELEKKQGNKKRPEDIFNPTGIDDARLRTLRAMVQRQGQPKFRRELLKAYGRRCAITECDAVEALEAAHIIGYLGSKTNHPTNGLLLRADLHSLFDLSLIAVDSVTMTVLIAPSLIKTVYVELAGKQVRLPDDPTCKPSREAIDQHREQAGL